MVSGQFSFSPASFILLMDILRKRKYSNVNSKAMDCANFEPIQETNIDRKKAKLKVVWGLQ